MGDRSFAEAQKMTARSSNCLWLGAILSMASLAAPPSPVADAAMHHDVAAVRALLAQKANVNTPQPDGATALMWGVRANDLEMVDLLLAAGGNVKAANRDGATALYQASENGNAP